MASREPELHWIDDRTFSVAGVEFVHGFDAGSRPDRFFIRKKAALVAEFVDVLREVRGGNLVELGIAQGGSTALAALIAQPRKLVAVDVAGPVAALEEFVVRHGLGDRVRTHYEVDQADRARLAAVVEAEFGSEDLDVVFDDASHLLEPTRASFEVLFPRVRPGGRYVIEDWNWQHKWATAIERQASGAARSALAAAMADAGTLQPPPSLAALVLELVLARAGSGEVVGGLAVGPHWVVVTRGPGALDRDAFRLADAVTDPFGLLP